MADVHFCKLLKPLCPLASFRSLKNGSDWAMSPAIRKISGRLMRKRRRKISAGYTGSSAK
ncbi:hypothetical protein HanIR_Chr15g0773201 [Helianthus annuus]|nr:hypothetical protein HanIR_Chr15g0773201 [Helianthus annuus]